MNPVQNALSILGNVPAVRQFSQAFNDPYNPQDNDTLIQNLGRFIGGSPAGGAEHALAAGVPMLAMRGMKVLNQAPQELKTGDKLIRVGGKLINQNTLTAEQLAKRQFGLNLQRPVADLVQVGPRKLIPDALAQAMKLIEKELK